MISPNQLAEHYVDVWNETDATLRRTAIARLWAPEGEHAVRTLHARGHDELERRITASHDKNVQAGGYRFRSAGDAQPLRNSLMFHWHMVDPQDKRIAAVGLEFLLLASDGRIVMDYQFILPTPAP